MKLSDFQAAVFKLSDYPDKGNNFIIPGFGLSEESGEVVGRIKKTLKNKGGKFSEDDLDNLHEELGDTLIYLSELCDEFGFKLANVAKNAIIKLEEKKKLQKR